jgi:hypothetical protein
MFCFKPRKTAAKTLEKPRAAFGDDVGKTQSSDLFS